MSGNCLCVEVEDDDEGILVGEQVENLKELIDYEESTDFRNLEITLVYENYRLFVANGEGQELCAMVNFLGCQGRFDSFKVTWGVCFENLENGNHGQSVVIVS